MFWVAANQFLCLGLQKKTCRLQGFGFGVSGVRNTLLFPGPFYKIYIYLKVGNSSFIELAYFNF